MPCITAGMGQEVQLRCEMLAALVSEGGFHRIFLSWWAWLLLFTRKSTWYFLGLRLVAVTVPKTVDFPQFQLINEVVIILVVVQRPIPMA